MSKTDDKKGKKGVAIIIAVGGKPPNSPTKTLDPDEKKKMADAWDFLKSQGIPSKSVLAQDRKSLSSARYAHAKDDGKERAQVEMQQGKLTDSGEDPLPVVGQSGYDMRETEDRPLQETLDPAMQHGLSQREISGPLMGAKDQRPPLNFSDPPNPFEMKSIPMSAAWDWLLR